MAHKPLDIPTLLDRLEAFHGPQEARWPVDPYEFLIWWHCGYPASDAACARGWTALLGQVGIEPDQILAAPQARLSNSLKAGGMVPELRAMRIRQIAHMVQEEFGGDLEAALKRKPSEAPKILKRFPGIRDPGADRMLLFAHLRAVAAVPSNCPHVLVRIQHGVERPEYGATYREAQLLIQALPEQFRPRTRAYLLLKEHGQSLCKRIRPNCDPCPVNANCAYFAGGTGRNPNP